MANNDNVTRKAPSDGRLGRWTMPVVKRLAAGAAENGSGTNPDDQINHS